MAIHLKNTRTGKVEEFIPIAPHTIGMYHCGPTVYDFAHIGNLRAYVFADVLRRMFEASDYTVTQIINITDVGHLVSDGDEGEDKIEKGARREGKNIEDIIALYTNAFLEDLDALNIMRPHIMPRATEHIPEQIEMIKKLEAGGHTYHTSDGIYFDAATFPRYAEFAHLDLKGLKSGARIGENDEKRNPYDFALWKFSGNEKRLQEWDSPWGKGFPGWHIECSAMSQKYLGEQFDIHTGGIDHIPVHHTNEIAQSECATGKHPFVNYWMHSGFMTVEGEKMSKSLGNTYRLSDLKAKGISPAALRYWFLTAKYDTQINFTWDVLAEAQEKMWSYSYFMVFDESKNTTPNEEIIEKAKKFLQDDLHTPSIIALIDSIGARDVKTLERLLNLLGIDLTEHKKILLEIPLEITTLAKERDEARKMKDWKKSDELRDRIYNMGFRVQDLPEGTRIIKHSLS
jgi:cysteinyl-tRNA synthetase